MDAVDTNRRVEHRDELPVGIPHKPICVVAESIRTWGPEIVARLSENGSDGRSKVWRHEQVDDVEAGREDIATRNAACDSDGPMLRDVVEDGDGGIVGVVAPIEPRWK